MATEAGVIEIELRARLEQLEKDLAGGKAKAAKAGAAIGDELESKVTSKLERARTVATGVSSAFAGMKMSSVFTDKIADAGNVARIFGDQVSGAASSTGLSMDAIAAKAKSFEFIPPSVAAEGIKNLSLLNQSMGLTGQASLDLSGKTLEVAQAMSVVAGVPVEQVLDGVAGAARGEYDAIQRLVPSLNGAAVEQQALADSGKSVASELTEAEKSQAALNLILAEGNRYLPQLAANSDNAAAAQKRSAAAADEAKIAMGDKLLPIMEKVSNVTSTLFGWFSQLPGPVQTVILGAVVLGGVLAPLAFALSGAASALGALGIGGGAAAAGATAAGGAAAASSGGFFAMAAGAWAAVAPFIPLALGIAALIAIGVLLWKNWDTVLAVGKAVFGWVAGAAVAALGFLAANFLYLLGPIGIVIKHWGFFRDAASGAVGWVTAKLGSFVGFVTGIPGAIGRALGGAFDSLGDAFAAAINWIRGVWNRFVGRWNGITLRVPSIDLPFVGKVGGFSVGLPGLPVLDRGGIVDRPTLALLAANSRPEAIVPLDQMGSFGGGRGDGPPLTIIVQGSLVTMSEVMGLSRSSLADTARYNGSAGFAA